MANYKTADQLPILEEVTETTYALVEDGGSLKRVPGSNLGGSNCCVISIDRGAVVEPSEVAEGSVTYTCNMTYDELMGALQNKTLSGFSVNMYSGTEVHPGYVQEIYFGSDAPGIMISWILYDESNAGQLQFSSDNTISLPAPS